MIAFVLLYATVRAIHARREEGERTSVLRITTVILIMALVIYAPLAITILQQPNQFFTQIQGTSAGTFSGDIYTVMRRLLVNVWNMVAGISLQGDLSEGRNIPGRSLLDIFPSLLHWIGLSTAEIQNRRSAIYQMIID